MRLCPCGSGKPLEGCCGRFHAGEWPETAEQLMRSRYAAYALGLVDYLLETQVSQDRAGVEAFAREATFTGLEVVDAREDEVEFVASYSIRGQGYQLKERSRFERREGRWIYVDGVTPRAVSTRVGRNDPCPCGSGSKYKKCCGA